MIAIAIAMARSVKGEDSVVGQFEGEEGIQKQKALGSWLCSLGTWLPNGQAWLCDHRTVDLGEQLANPGHVDAVS